jgi:hypothetical protein
VIAAKPVHQLIVAEAPVWLIEEREKWQRAFFCAGKKRSQPWPVSSSMAEDFFT